MRHLSKPSSACDRGCPTVMHRITNDLARATVSQELAAQVCLCPWGFMALTQVRAEKGCNLGSATSIASIIFISCSLPHVPVSCSTASHFHVKVSSDLASRLLVLSYSFSAARWSACPCRANVATPVCCGAVDRRSSSLLLAITALKAASCHPAIGGWAMCCAPLSLKVRRAMSLT
jgi:hypothetical protein